jgi:outer membrane receptor protein involved in Fe transport
MFIMQSHAFSQANALRGKITSDEGEPLSSVSVMIKGSTTGSVTGDDGNFTLTTSQSLPFTVQLTLVGFYQNEVEVKSWSSFNAKLSPKAMMQELTLAPTRVLTKLIASPVSIEKIGFSAIQSTPAPTVYDAMGYLKGVDIVTSSLTFKTPTTRGFNGSGSARVNQWVDGMDNQAPGMNFSIGSFSGVTDLDLQSIEVLPGASSALYGPGGMSGTILINSKNPFKYPGLTIQVKEGMMNVDKKQRPGTTGYHNLSIRFAKIIGSRFAFKVAAEYLKATDWLAADGTNYDRVNGKTIAGTRSTDPNYDGVNTYGDETTVNLYAFVPTFFTNPTNVSRTGYDEKDVIDPKVKNLKLNGALHYKVGNNTEAILAGHWGTGSTVYTGSDRYSLNNVKIGQYKFELRNRNWFIRAYTTQEDAGDSYAATTITRYFNEAWKPSNIWYGEYVSTYIGAVRNQATNDQAHALARAVADKGRPEPGSPEFKQIMDHLKSIPISQHGGLFLDRSNLYMAEGQYNFGKYISFADVVIGGDYKRYELNSQGTIFIDTAGKINVNELGGYIQVTKQLFNKGLTLAGSGRIDKNENFAGKITPRFSALIKIAEDNNIRLSYQTAYRFPTTQQQYIKLQVGSNVYLLGGLPWIKDYMRTKEQPVVQLTANGTEPYTYKDLAPENSNAFEAGYRGLIHKKLVIDMYGYLSRFDNFLGRINLLQPGTGTIYSVVTNSDTKVKTHGYGIGINYFVKKNLTASANFYSDKITNVPSGFVASYNTPAYRFNMGLSSAGIDKQKKVGFGIQYKWQDAFAFENDFANGDVAAFSTVDAQVNYKLLKNKCELRIGGTNLLNHYYKNAFGNPEIGGLYYASIRVGVQ